MALHASRAESSWSRVPVASVGDGSGGGLDASGWAVP